MRDNRPLPFSLNHVRTFTCGRADDEQAEFRLSEIPHAISSAKAVESYRLLHDLIDNLLVRPIGGWSNPYVARSFSREKSSLLDTQGSPEEPPHYLKNLDHPVSRPSTTPAKTGGRRAPADQHAVKRKRTAEGMCSFISKQSEVGQYIGTKKEEAAIRRAPSLLPGSWRVNLTVGDSAGQPPDNQCGVVMRSQGCRR